MGVNHLISLQENMPTYGVGGSKVTGHVTISSPGMVRCYVQNLKKAEANANYVFCVISKGKDKAVKLGQLGEEREARWMVNQNNINGSGIKLEDIDAVALVVDYKDKGKDNVLLGFVDERYQVYRMIDELFPSMLEIDKLTPVTPKKIKVKQPEVEVQKQEVVKSIKKEDKAEPDKGASNEIKKEVIVIQKDKEDDYDSAVVDVKVVKKDVVDEEDSKEKKTVEIKDDINVVKEVKQEFNEKMSHEIQKEIDAEYENEQIDTHKVDVADVNAASEDIQMQDEADSNPVVETTQAVKEVTQVEEVEETEKVVKDKCKFILPRDAKVGSLEDKPSQADEAGIDEELRRIINIISQDKRVEQKARELERQILMLRQMTTEGSSDEKCSTTEQAQNNNEEENETGYRDEQENRQQEIQEEVEGEVQEQAIQEQEVQEQEVQEQEVQDKEVQDKEVQDKEEYREEQGEKDNKEQSNEIESQDRDKEEEYDEYEDDNKAEKDKENIIGYVGQKLNIKEAEEEDPTLDMSNTTPQDALSYMNNPITIPQENTPEENSINEAEQEYEYLRKIDVKLQQIRARMGETIKEVEQGNIN